MMRPSALMASATLLAGLLPVAPGARAQSSDQAGGPSGGLEEIVVTARWREEKAQTVPITLETFTPLKLQQNDIRDPLKLMDYIPGFSGATGASLGLQYTFLRGAPGVIFYWNQVPVNAQTQDQGLFFDLDSLQVLYGPQGTLFGLSNDAGAILYEPKHPANGYEGYAQITLGDYGRETIEGVINVPVVEDKLLVRLGAQYQKQDGYEHVIQQNLDLLNQNYWNFRGAATFRPTDNFQNEIMVNYFQTHYLPGAYVFGGYNPGPAQAFGIPLQQILNYAKLGYLGPGPAAQLANQNVNLQQLLVQQQALGKYAIAATSVIPTAVLNELNIVDTASWDVTDNMTIKNIAGYQEIDNYNNREDIGGLGFGLLQGPTPLGDQQRGPAVQYNEEIQFIGNFFDDKLNVQAGFFNQWGQVVQGGAADTRAPYGIYYINDFGGLSVTGATFGAVSRTDALYTQETYNLGDYIEGLSFTAGFRYTWDKFYTSGNSYDAFGHITGSQSQSARFTSPSYTFQLSYQWRPQTLFYINNSLGYKTGGFNGQNFVGPFAIYRPEHLNNYEAGVKSDFDLGPIGMESVKARINGSMYYGVYRGIEIQTTGAYLEVGSPLPKLGTPYLDVGDGDLWGWDFQFTVLPIPDLEINGDAEFNKGKYKNFQGPNANGTGQVSEQGVAFETLPEYKFTGGFTYHFSFIDKAYGDVSLSGTYSWTQHSFDTDQPNLGPFDIIPGYHNVDMSLDWNDVMGHTGLLGRIWVTNLTNNSVVNGILGAYEAIGEVGYQPAQPRMWGVTLRYSFGP